MSWILAAMFGSCVGLFVSSLLTMARDCDDLRDAGETQRTSDPRIRAAQKAALKKTRYLATINCTDKSVAGLGNTIH